MRIFAGFWGAMRTEARRNGTSNMLEFSARIRRVSAYMPVTLTGGVKKLVLTHALNTTRIAVFCERLSARLGAHEPQAYRVHAPVVNTALGCHHSLRLSSHHGTKRCVYVHVRSFWSVVMMIRIRGENGSRGNGRRRRGMERGGGGIRLFV